MTSSCLLVIDVQNDFCSGGALAVPDGEAVVPVINQLVHHFEHTLATQDWHPAHHSSFASQHSGKQPFDVVDMDYGSQVLWPDHCVQGSEGAAFHSELETSRYELTLRKGFRPHIDSYSAFYENDHATSTGLKGYLESRAIKSLYLVGLATDFCVAYSAIDAAKNGFEAIVVEDACRGIDLNGSMAVMKTKMNQAGVRFVSSQDLA